MSTASSTKPSSTVPHSTLPSSGPPPTISSGLSVDGPLAVGPPPTSVYPASTSPPLIPSLPPETSLHDNNIITKMLLLPVLTF